MNAGAIMVAGLVITMVACSSRPKRGESALSLPVATAPDWEAIFTRTEGWTGADGAATLPLSGERLLWLFGDSFIGPVRAGKHAEGTAMVNNTIAVSGVGASPPAIRFLWNTRGPQPAAWAVPEQKGEWFWPASGGVTAPGPDGRDRLVLFMSRIARIDASDSVWNFRARGTTALIVHNPGEAPEAWKASQSTLTTLPTEPGSRLLMWGSGAEIVPGKNGPEVMILGIDETNVFDKKLMLARAPAASVEHFSSWKFRTQTGWSEREADATPVLSGMSSELSLHRVRLRGRDCLVLVYSEGNLGRGILARVCSYPDGEWSEPVRLYDCPEPGADRNLMVYSAKGHPEVSRHGEMLVSYSVNSTDFKDVLAHADKYRPRFIHVPLANLPPAP